MSLGTSALKAGREPERLRHANEESMATLRAGTTHNTHLYKVLRERRNPQTGGDQGTSELPQQPQAPRNLRGEPSPGVRHISLVHPLSKNSGSRSQAPPYATQACLLSRDGKLAAVHITNDPLVTFSILRGRRTS